MRVAPFAVLPFVVLALPAASGCTRTYDGSIMPAYQPMLVTSGGMTRMEIQPTDPEPPNRFYKFPAPPAAAPPPPVVTVETERRPIPRRARARSARPAAAPQDSQPAGLQCRPARAVDGRFKMECA